MHVEADGKVDKTPNLSPLLQGVAIESVRENAAANVEERKIERIEEKLV